MQNFRNLDDQLSILRNRGLIIDDDNRARDYLLTNNYHTIINGYSKFFMLDDEKTYIEHATFDEITHLYIFEKEIKSALFNALAETEHHIKSILAYNFAEEHPLNISAYLDEGSYSKSDSDLKYLINNLKDTLRSNINNEKANNSLKDYSEEHGQEVPIWVLIDYLTFGQTAKIIIYLPENLQNKIAFSLTSFINANAPTPLKDPFYPNVLISFLEHLRRVRNVCAHNNQLLGFSWHGSVKYFPELHERYDISVGESQNSVYTALIILQCFLSQTQYAILHNTIHKRINTLDNRLKSISINKILACLGFPENWHRLTAKIAQK
ncbi:Abi family protein [Streptococcaceae bacterium ESL0729]|nr:Abi family protein [Streptococcaceae bacterium ESL0729]